MTERRTTQVSRSLSRWFWPTSQPSQGIDQHQKHTTSPRDGVLTSLRTALEEVPQGIVLLDANLRAQFINRAFRAMWRLPDTIADSTPAFATLLSHGRDTHAYDLPDDALEDYIEHRLAQVRMGDPDPVDLHVASGDIIRCQCTKLPDGGRMLSYTDVTELVRRADNLGRLRAALDNIEHGIILLDRDLNVEFHERGRLPPLAAARQRTRWQAGVRRPCRTCAPKQSLGDVRGGP
jgi:PAS domain-containing protein